MSFFKKFGATLLGVAAGFAFGPGAFSALAFSIGSTIGSLLFNRPVAQDVSLGDLQQPKSEYGAFIPICHGGDLEDDTKGGVMLAGQFIDCDPNGAVRETKIEGNVPLRDLSVAVLWCEGEQDILEIWANDKMVYNAAGATGKEKGYELTLDPVTGVSEGKPPPAESNDYLWNYRGNHVQPVNPFLAEVHGGEENVPAYRGICYSVFKNLPLAQFDYSLPSLRALVKDGITGKVELIEAWSVRSNLPSSALELSHISGEVRGQFMVSGGNSREKIEELANYDFCDVVEIDGKVKDSSRRDPVIHEIPASDLGAAVGGSDLAPALVVEVGQMSDVPSEVGVNFIDIDNEYQQSVAKALGVPSESANPKSIDISVVASLPEMTKWAQPALDEAIAAKDNYELSLPSAWLNVGPGDVLHVPDVNGTAQIRVTELTAGLTGPIQVKGVSFDPDVYENHREVTPVTRPTPAVTTYGEVEALFINAMSGLSEMVDGPCFLAALTNDDGTLWPTAQISWQQRLGSLVTKNVNAPCTVGTATNVLADFAGAGFDWDETSTVDIAMTNGTLTSSDSDGVSDYENYALLGSNTYGWEWLRFRDVEDLGVIDGKQSYRLSGFRRGDAGTEHLCDTHHVGDRFVLIDKNVQVIPCGPNDVGRVAYINVLDNGVTVEHTFTPTAKNLTTLAPIHIVGARDGGSNWRFDWEGRDRALSTWWINGQKVYSENIYPGDYIYDIDIYDGGDVVRTLQSATPTVTYDASAEISDFGAPQSSITIRVYQRGTSGRGVGATVTITE